MHLHLYSKSLQNNNWILGSCVTTRRTLDCANQNGASAVHRGLRMQVRISSRESFVGNWGSEVGTTRGCLFHRAHGIARGQDAAEVLRIFKPKSPALPSEALALPAI